jgi:hypothetical protein
LTGRRDVIITAVQDLMRDRKLVVDENASRLSDGIIVSQPFTFTKGAVVAQADLSRYADVPASNARGWTRGRYTLTVEVQPIDGTAANVSVNAKVEGPELNGQRYEVPALQKISFSKVSSRLSPVWLLQDGIPSHELTFYVSQTLND